MPFQHPLSRRPKRTNPEQVKADVVAGLAHGLPLAVVCRRNSVDPSQVSRWQSRDPAYAEEIAQARALGWDSLAVECLEIADDTSNDVIDTPDGPRPNSAAVLSRKLMIDTRLKLLACWDTGRYGPSRTLKVEGEVQTTVKHALDPRQLDDAGRASLRALLDYAARQGLLPGPEPVDAEYEEVEAEADD